VSALFARLGVAGVALALGGFVANQVPALDPYGLWVMCVGVALTFPAAVLDLMKGEDQ